MGTGYTRNDTDNNIADGNVINAADFDGEFDAIVTAFSTSGHTHDGTSAEGGPVTVLGPAQDFVVSATTITPKTTNTLDLGTSSLLFKDAFFDGNITTGGLIVDNAGSIGSVSDNNAITISSGGVVAVTATTASSSATTGALTVAGGAGVAADLSVGDDLRLISDSSVLSFGADSDTTLTHTDGSGLTLNSTNKIMFNDASQFIQGSSGTVLSLGATSEIDLTASTIDINGNLDVSGTIVGASTLSATTGTFSGILKTDDTTEATSTTDGSLQTDGGLSVAKDAVIGDDLKLLSDSSVLSFGADSDTTLTHTDGTGLTLNSTNKLTFGDADSFIQQSGDGTLRIDGEAIIDLNASTRVDVSGDLKVGDDLSLASDSAVLSFGADSEITVTHVHNEGLAFKHTATTDDTPIILTLQSGEVDMDVNDVVGAIRFQTPDAETGVGDARLVVAAIQAVAEGSYSDTVNTTRLEFHTAVSEAASSKMTLSSAGLLTIADDFMIKDGGTIGVASTNDAITISSAGIVTFKDDIIIKDGGTIGSASDTDAITIIASGNVGIGTSTIGDKLVVQGASSATASIVIQDPTANDHGTHLSYDDANSKAIFGGLTNGTKNPALRVARDAASGIDIDANGNVGIGTASPSVLLDLESTAPTIKLTDSDATGTPECEISGAGGDLIFRADKDNEKGSSLVAFEVDGSEKMRIDSNGELLIGHSSSVNFNAESHELQVSDTNFSLASFATYRNGSDGANISLGHSRNATKGSHTVVNDDDQLGAIAFYGSDGTDFEQAARIEAQVDGTPADDATDMPGRLVFSTTADGSDSPTERMRIDSSGNVLFGGKTSSAFGTAGTELLATGQATFTRSGNTPVSINRLSDDGNLLSFSKAGADIGQFGSNTTGGEVLLDLNATKNFRIVTNSSEAMRIDSSGLVGINNTSPSSQIAGAADLVIGDTSDADSGMTFVTSTSGQGLIHFSDATSGDARFDGFIGYEQNNRALKFGTAQTERMRIKSTGEILHTLPSEDTTFAAGTDSTWNRFEIFQDRGAADTASGIAFRSQSGTAPAGIVSVALNTTGGREELAFITSAGNASGERMRIDENGNVGIGTDSPAAPLHTLVDSSTTNDTVDVVRIEATSSGTPAVGFGPTIRFQGERAGAASDMMGRIGFVADNMTSSRIDGAFVVETGIDGTPTERMRIDSSGKLLVGKTSSDYSVEGVEVRSNEVLITKAGENPLSVRNNAAGGLISLNSGGTSAGSIGSAGGSNNEIFISAGAGKAILINNNGLLPATSSGGGSNDTTDLGQNDVRFKDLYLSGNVIVANDKGIDFSAQTSSSASGVTTADEVLTHYERGEWTAAWSPGSGSITVDNSFKTGRYERIGNVCFITLHIRASSVSTPSGQLKITGLPFSTPNNSEFRHSFGVPFFFGLTSMTNGLVPIVYLGQNSAELIIGVQSTNSIGNLDASKIIANSELYITGHFHV